MARPVKRTTAKRPTAKETTMDTSTRNVAPLSLAALALTLAAAGCGEEFKPGSYIERPRVVGAQVSIAGDPEGGRATVRPGEQATVTWLTVSRQDPSSLALAWGFVLCPGSDRACAGPPLATFTGEGPTVAVTFTMPDQAALGSAPSAALLGAICAGGTLSFDGASAVSCAGAGASQTDVAFTVPLQVGDAANHNPRLDDEVLRLDGADWPASAMPPVDAACDAGAGLPMVTATPVGQTAIKRHILFVSDGDDRETYLAGTPAAPTLESLQLSQFTTAGKLLHSYSAIPGSDTRPDADVTIDWEPPAASEVPAEGLVVQFHFVARDLRGGVGWTHRALCVHP